MQRVRPVSQLPNVCSKVFSWTADLLRAMRAAAEEIAVEVGALTMVGYEERRKEWVARTPVVFTMRNRLGSWSEAVASSVNHQHSVR